MTIRVVHDIAPQSLEIKATRRALDIVLRCATLVVVAGRERKPDVLEARPVERPAIRFPIAVSAYHDQERIRNYGTAFLFNGVR